MLLSMACPIIVFRPKLNTLCQQTMVSCMRSFGALSIEYSKQSADECAKIAQKFDTVASSDSLAGQLKAVLRPVMLNLSAAMVDRRGSRDVVTSPTSPTSPMSPATPQPRAPRAMARAPSFTVPPTEVHDYVNMVYGSYVCTWDFEAMNPTEIGLTAGERVNILERCDDTGNTEWCKVETADGRQGFVATEYIKEIDHDDEEGHAEPETPDVDAKAPPLPTAVPEPAPEARKSCTVGFDFEGTNDGELSVAEDQELEVMSYTDSEGNDEWCQVRDTSGAEGYVPANYLNL